MPKRTRQSALPTAAIAAAMLLSISASADASLIASLMQTGQPRMVAQTSRDGISDWFTRLTDAAHHLQRTFDGDHGPVLGLALAVTGINSRCNAPMSQSKSTRLHATALIGPVVVPISDNTTNLPPPAA